jgi:uncharacterized protein (DUF3084 family)
MSKLVFDINEITANIQTGKAAIAAEKTPLIAVRGDIEEKTSSLKTEEEIIKTRQKYIDWQNEKIRQNGVSIIEKRAELKLLLNDISVREKAANSIMQKAQTLISDSECICKKHAEEYQSFLSEKKGWEIERENDRQEINSIRRAYQLASEQK